MFGRGFTAKCKLLIKATRSRIEMVRKRVVAKQRFLKDDLAKLIYDGLDMNAYERMEEFVAGINLLSFYDFMDRACEHVTKQLKKMEKQGDCPEECREDVALLMFAAARFADLPELRDLRDIFQQRYGSSLEASFHQKFVERLSPLPPSPEEKIQVMQNIVQEFSIMWDPGAFERRLVNPSQLLQAGAQRADQLKQKPGIPHEGQRGGHSDNNSNWRRDEADRHNAGWKFAAAEYKEQLVLKDDVTSSLGGRQALYRNKHLNHFEEDHGKEPEPKVQKPSSSSKRKMLDSDGIRFMELRNGKPETRNGGRAKALSPEKVEFDSVQGEQTPVRKNLALSPRRIEQDKVQNTTIKKVEAKPDEVKSFSNYGIPPPYVKAKDSFARPPYTKPKEDNIGVHGRSKSAASDSGHPNYGKVAPAVDAVKNTGSLDVEPEHKNHRSARRNHHKSSSSSRVMDSPNDDTLNQSSTASPKNHSGKGLQVLFDEDYHTKDEEEILMDKLLLHYSKKPSLYDSEKVPNFVDRPSQLPRGRNKYDDDHDNDGRQQEKAPAPSRSTSLPCDPPLPTTSSSAGTKKVLNRASTFQPDNQAKHVHPKLPDYDDLAAKFAALKGR